MARRRYFFPGERKRNRCIIARGEQEMTRVSVPAYYVLEVDGQRIGEFRSFHEMEEAARPHLTVYGQDCPTSVISVGIASEEELKRAAKEAKVVSTIRATEEPPAYSDG